jgi:superoxide reductase
MNEAIYTAENPGEWNEKKEKHIPSITVSENSISVKVGIETHPMEATHYIEWIGVFQNGVEIHHKDLQPDESPEMVFENITDFSNLTVREKCNLHGVWEAKVVN